jgi:hypothetical protein
LLALMPFSAMCALPFERMLGDMILTNGQEVFVAYRRKSANTNNADPFTHIELQDQQQRICDVHAQLTLAGLLNSDVSVGSTLRRNITSL